jgi:hypothetical protein
VPVARDHHTFEGSTGRPMLLDRERHGRARLARTDNQGPARRRPREMPGQYLERVGGGYCRMKASNQQLSWVHVPVLGGRAGRYGAIGSSTDLNKGVPGSQRSSSTVK